MAIFAPSCPHSLFSTTTTDLRRRPPPPSCAIPINSQLYIQRQTPPTSTEQQRTRIDRSLLHLSEVNSEAELWANARLRVRSFCNFDEGDFGIQDHKKYLAEREFEALKERIAGKREGFRKVTCIDATLPLSQVATISDDLCSTCKFSVGEEEKVVVGTLDLCQSIKLPDEIAGLKPKGIGADYARAYLSNVCVANELQRNGLGHDLISRAKLVAQAWGISDLYVHVAVDNEAAKKLYIKCGFEQESEETAMRARLLDRPRRLILWTALPVTYDL